MGSRACIKVLKCLLTSLLNNYHRKSMSTSVEIGRNKKHFTRLYIIEHRYKIII